MTTNHGPRDLLPFLEAEARRLEVELELARERVRRCVDEIESEERRAAQRAAQPTVRLRKRIHGRRGETLAFGAMPPPPTQPPPPSTQPVERDAGRYEVIVELSRKRARDSARFTGGSR